MEILKSWVDGAPILILGGAVILLMIAAVAIGVVLKRRREHGKGDQEEIEGEGYVVSGVLGLLALLMGFTFALAVDRFDTRRGLVLEEANTIGTTYLRTQLLEEPHRSRISGLLVEYAENRLALGKTDALREPERLARNDQLVVELWAATSSAFQSIKGLDFSSAYLDSMNALIDLDASRKAARTVHVPTEVFVILVIYMVVTAGVLGYVLVGVRGRAAAAFMLLLLSMALLLIVDIDRPTRGGVREGQGPMERLVESLKTTPASAYDRFRIKDARPAASR
jgi:hypothetical protein